MPRPRKHPQRQEDPKAGVGTGGLGGAFATKGNDTRGNKTENVPLARAAGAPGCVCKLGCPAWLSPGSGRESRPAEPYSPPCLPASKCSRPGIPSTPGAPWVPSGGAAPHPPSFPKANFSAGALYLFGGFAAAQSAVSAAHPPPGAPGLRLPTLGPPENPAVQALLPAWRPPAGAAGETLKLNLEEQT